MHYVGAFLETNYYVRVLNINFCNAFDTVNHGIFIKNILALDMPANINHWLIFSPAAHRSANSVCQFHLT